MLICKKCNKKVQSVGDGICTTCWLEQQNDALRAELAKVKEEAETEAEGIEFERANYRAELVAMAEARDKAIADRVPFAEAYSADLSKQLAEARRERDVALEKLRETEETLELAVGDCEALREREWKIREWAERSLDNPGWRRNELLAILDAANSEADIPLSKALDKSEEIAARMRPNMSKGATKVDAFSEHIDGVNTPERDKMAHEGDYTRCECGARYWPPGEGLGLMELCTCKSDAEIQPSENTEDAEFGTREVVWVRWEDGAETLEFGEAHDTPPVVGHELARATVTFYVPRKPKPKSLAERLEAWCNSNALSKEGFEYAKKLCAEVRALESEKK